MTLLRIRRAEVLPGLTIRLWLTDGGQVERDLDGLLRGPVFEPLRRDPALFARVRIQHGTLSWPGGVDLDPDVVIWGGPAPHGDVAPLPFLAVAVPS